MSRKTTHLWAEVQAWLDELNWTPSQAALAERLGLKSRSVITDWKYGSSRPTPEHLGRLATEMELTAGPQTYQRLLFAVLADMGYDLERLRAKPMPRAAERMEQLVKESQEQWVAEARQKGWLKEEYFLSEPSDTTEDLLAADDQEQPISAEVEEPEHP